MKNLDDLINKQVEGVIHFLENCLKDGFEGGYYPKYIHKSLGDALNKNGISFNTYTTDNGEFTESKVWYRKGDVVGIYRCD